MDSWAIIETHSYFFKHLIDSLGHSLTYQLANENVQLKRFNTYSYDNLILMTPSIKGSKQILTHL